MSKNKIFLFFVIAFLVGIFFGNILFHTKLIIFFLSLSGVFLMLLLFVFKKYLFFVVIFGMGLCLSSVVSIIMNTNIENKISFVDNFIEKNVAIEGKIQELYKKSENYNSYIVQIYTIDNIERKDIDFLLYTSTNLLLDPGELIRIEGKINEVENFSHQFNYVKFLQSKNIFFIINKPKIEFRNQKDISKWKQKIIDLRQKILEIIYNLYPRNEAVFLAGILIGAREDMSKELSQHFNNSGLTHLVAVSGFNITIIIIFLGVIFKYIPIIFRTFLICFFVLFFVLIVGDNVPVMRAGIMGLVGYFILVTGRKADSLSLLLFTAFLMVLYNPLSLNYDISFHLSFLAVLGLLYFQDFWNRVFVFLPSFFAIKESFVLTMSALTTTLPIMIFNFGQFSILAPVSNMLVGGVIPFAMFFGFFSILGEIIFDKIGFIIGFINYFFLTYVIFIADFFGSLDVALLKIDFGMYAIYGEIIYFMLLVFGIIYFKQEKNPTS